MLVGYFGCIGAWKINQCALSFFSIILTLLIVLELASAILLVQKQEHVKHYVESSMYDTIQNRYNSESAFKNAFDKIQEEFQCCGVRMYTDWLSTNWEADGLTSLNVDNKYSAKIEHGIGSYGVIGKNVYGPVPVSCCNNHGKLLYHENCGTSFVQAPLSTYAQFLNTRGCVDVMYDSVHKSLNTVVAICVLLCAIQIVGVVLSVLLCCFPSHHK
uniref:Tetraspanin n=1 Tax=Caenorhabditis japonica TaxID=281687 RepID=A0A8R1DI67_CAEJA